MWLRLLADQPSMLYIVICQFELFPIPDISNVDLLQFSDSVQNCRTIPEYGQPTKNKTVISKSSVFHIDTERQTVSIQDNGAVQKVVSQIFYLVKSAL